MDSSELSKKIFDCLSDGYDDEELRQETEITLDNELSKINDNNVIKKALIMLCDRIEELEE